MMIMMIGMIDFALPEAPESMIAKSTSSAIGRLLDALLYVPLVSLLMNAMDTPSYQPSSYLPLPWRSVVRSDDDDSTTVNGAYGSGHGDDSNHPLNR